MIKKEEAKKRIRELWREYERPPAKFPEAMNFYNFLRQEHPEVLNFRSNPIADKYQIIKGFISHFHG